MYRSTCKGVTAYHASELLQILVDTTHRVEVTRGPDNQIKPDPDKPDVDADISGLGWLLSLVLGFVTGGAMGVLIVAVVDMVVESTASSIGEGIVDDPDFNMLY